MQMAPATDFVEGSPPNGHGVKKSCRLGTFLPSICYAIAVMVRPSPYGGYFLPDLGRFGTPLRSGLICACIDTARANGDATRSSNRQCFEDADANANNDRGGVQLKPSGARVSLGRSGVQALADDGHAGGHPKWLVDRLVDLAKRSVKDRSRHPTFELSL